MATKPVSLLPAMAATLLLVAVLLLLQFPSPSESLRCNVCSNVKARRNDTCGDRRMWSVVHGTDPRDDRCRVLRLGGVIVGQGMVSERLCTQEAITTLKMKMTPLYNGGGAREAFCCSVDFCTDPDPPGADGASSFVYDPVGGGGGAVNSLEEQKGQFMAGQQLNRSPLNENSGESASLRNGDDDDSGANDSNTNNRWLLVSLSVAAVAVATACGVKF